MGQFWATLGTAGSSLHEHMRSRRVNRIATRILLGTLLEADRPISRRRIMKLLFMMREETSLAEQRAFYEFLPYKYGPYSFSVDRDLASLREDGAVTEAQSPDGSRWSLNHEHRESILALYRDLPARVRSGVRDVVRFAGSFDDRRFVEHIYSRYPSYTYLTELDLPHRERPVAVTTVYTLGYEGVTIDGFLDVLLQNGILRVMDIRSNPVSRVYGYARKTLSRMCEHIGVAYEHLPELGVQSEDRREARSQADYAKLFRQYEDGLVSEHQPEVDRAASLMVDVPSVLICYEADHRSCHRSRLAKVLSERTALPIHHLRPDDGRVKKSTHHR